MSKRKDHSSSFLTYKPREGENHQGPEENNISCPSSGTLLESHPHHDLFSVHPTLAQTTVVSEIFLMGGSLVAIQPSIADRMGQGLEQLRMTVLDLLLFARIATGYLGIEDNDVSDVRSTPYATAAITRRHRVGP